ncbi:MAG: hypothetical protein CVU02_02810 [Bacteroidetes bacterium HGW-Bacteroidetes-19]|nr:MAG: hypothetical protein CVU02_02810 [Bacteroidetes bacterium HGW-Bacteroidetes-19]
MAFGNYPPLFLSSLGKSNFEATFKVNLNESEFQALLPILQTYWTVRVGYFSRNGIDLKVIGEGLDPDDVRDWFEKIPQSDSETFFRNYLARLEHFAQAGRDVGGFHRVILTMSRDKSEWKKGTKDTDGVDDPDTLSPENETATKILKLQVMQEALASALNQLPDESKLLIYNEIDPSQANISDLLLIKQ